MFAFASTEKRRNGLLPQVFLPFVSCALARSILESVASELISPCLSLSFITSSPFALACFGKFADIGAGQIPFRNLEVTCALIDSLPARPPGCVA